MGWAAALGLVGGGALLSGLGGAFGASSANKAGQRAFNQSLDMYERQQQNLLGLLYGNAAPNASFMGGTWGSDGRFHPGFQPETQYVPSSGAGQGIWGPNHPSATDGSGGGQRNAGSPGFNIAPAGNGLLARMYAVAQKHGQGADQIMGQYDDSTNSLLGQMTAGTNRLEGLGAGAEGMARQWGVGREKIIRDDAARSLKDANAMSDAALVAGGFNSPTMRAGNYAGNASENERIKQRALQDLSESQIDRQLGARQNRTSTLASRLGMSDQIAAGRSSDRTGLLAQFLNQRTALESAPLQTELQAGMSSIMNPWLGNNMSSYNPGQSALGSALRTFGNIGTGLGGFLAANQLWKDRPGTGGTGG